MYSFQYTLMMFHLSWVSPVGKQFLLLVSFFVVSVHRLCVIFCICFLALFLLLPVGPVLMFLNHMLHVWSRLSYHGVLPFCGSRSNSTIYWCKAWTSSCQVQYTSVYSILYMAHLALYRCSKRPNYGYKRTRSSWYFSWIGAVFILCGHETCHIIFWLFVFLIICSW